MPKKLVLEVTDGGCIVPTSHKLNKDGYFRKNIGNGVWAMYHRYVWEQAYGEIPEDHEVNHKCKNRACCNLDHLEVLLGTDHTILTNKERYAATKEEAYRMWETGSSVKDIADCFGYTYSSVYRWAREWKELSP